MQAKTKRVVLTLYNPDIIELIESIPKGHRSMIVEAALLSFAKNEAAQSLIELLICRRKGKKQNKVITRQKENPIDILTRLKGDFD